MTIDKERLRVLAEAATPGPWEWDDAVWEDYDPKERAPWLMAGGSLIDPVITGEVHCGEADAHYIAAASPKTVLALLAENAALAAEVERTSNNRDMWKAQCAAQAKELERLRKDEREAYAKVCDEQAESHELFSNTQATKGCDDCATAIRARGMP